MKRLITFIVISLISISSMGQTKIGNHVFVDLGLPSRTKWATCNVGASSPEDYGDYFAWGETAPKKEYSWNSYLFRIKGNNSKNVIFSKYNIWSAHGVVDNKTCLDSSDDVARASWGYNWRMPTAEEMNELQKECTWTWTKLGGRNGYKVTGKNGEWIFFPAAGAWEGKKLEAIGYGGAYWTSEFQRIESPAHLYFDEVTHGELSPYSGRYHGFSVRPVLKLDELISGMLNSLDYSKEEDVMQLAQLMAAIENLKKEEGKEKPSNAGSTVSTVNANSSSSVKSTGSVTSAGITKSSGSTKSSSSAKPSDSSGSSVETYRRYAEEALARKDYDGVMRYAEKIYQNCNSFEPLADVAEKMRQDAVNIYPNDKKAFVKPMEYAASLGNAHALYTLGVQYAAGTYLPKDEAKGLALLKASESLGYSQAGPMYNQLKAAFDKNAAIDRALRERQRRYNAQIVGAVTAAALVVATAAIIGHSFKNAPSYSGGGGIAYSSGSSSSSSTGSSSTSSSSASSSRRYSAKVHLRFKDGDEPYNSKITVYFKGILNTVSASFYTDKHGNADLTWTESQGTTINCIVLSRNIGFHDTYTIDDLDINDGGEYEICIDCKY